MRLASWTAEKIAGALWTLGGWIDDVTDVLAHRHRDKPGF